MAAGNVPVTSLGGIRLILTSVAAGANWACAKFPIANVTPDNREHRSGASQPQFLKCSVHVVHQGFDECGAAVALRARLFQCGDPSTRHAPPIAPAPARTGILAGIVAARQYLSIARLFRESRDMPFQPPRERMKPEHSSIQQRHPLKKRIVLPNALAFVGEYGLELSLRPLRPICGQNHYRVEPSHGDGC